jgi:predicted O-methyltransferase YrrM
MGVRIRSRMRPSIEAVKEYFKDKKIHCAELGVSVGDHAVEMLTGYPEIEQIHLVDTFATSYAHAKDVSKKKLEQCGFADKIIWHYMTTVEASKEVPDNSLDFVYVDAGHADFEVEADIRAWWSKLKEDGMMCGHDFNLCGRMEGAKTAVDKVFKELNLPVSVVATYMKPPYNEHPRWTRRMRTSMLSDWWVYKIEYKDEYWVNGIKQ